MGFRKAQRKQTKLRITLGGASGAGKTYSALRLARGLTTSWERVAVICSEQGSAEKYSDLGPYSVLVLKDFSPKAYIAALAQASPTDFDVVVLDSATHEWKFCNEWASKIESSGRGNRFTAWNTITPEHDAFVRAIVTHPLHAVCTTRAKSEYVLTENDRGKQVPKKVGMKDEQRDGWEYEFDLALRLDRDSHLANVDKTRLAFLNERMPFLVTEEFGRELLEWANAGVAAPAPSYQATPDQKRWLFSLMHAAGFVSEPPTAPQKERLNHISEHVVGWPLARVEEYVRSLSGGDEPPAEGADA
jgi:hypothetical protein